MPKYSATSYSQLKMSESISLTTLSDETIEKLADAISDKVVYSVGEVLCYTSLVGLVISLGGFCVHHLFFSQKKRGFPYDS